MNIYKLTRKDSTDWDEYDSAIIAANSEDEVVLVPLMNNDMFWDISSYWNKENLNVECIGITDVFNKPTCILASFHAG
jgi:hypothetical protein